MNKHHNEFYRTDLSYIEEKLGKGVCNQKLVNELYDLRDNIQRYCNYHIDELKLKMRERNRKKGEK